MRFSMIKSPIPINHCIIYPCLFLSIISLKRIKSNKTIVLITGLMPQNIAYRLIFSAKVVHFYK